ncbi:MAG: hypothetical protein KA198_07565, partial [Chitinophagaceae bacterium]|nr:hypothetical protein [Chitinophagaceae bacterium]
MKQTKLSLAGSSKAAPQINTLNSFFPDVQISSFDVRVTRSGEAQQHKLTVDANDMVLVEFEGNIQWIYDQNQFDSKLKQQQQKGRSIKNIDGEYSLPSEWHDETGTRGFLGDALKLIGINVFKNVSGKPVAKAIAAHIEKNNCDILYACNDSFQFIGPFESIKAEPKPYLLFLHGTASSAAGSFGGLQTENKGNAYQTLFKQYEKRVLAYEHRTLTESPVKNILELLKQFPAEITLDVITHSRGGLLGELLARVADSSIDGAFTKTEIEALKKNEEAKELVKEIEALNLLAKKKKVTIAHYVRVACPAAGTTLISKRVDTFLNVMFNGMSFIGGEVLGTFVDGLQALVMAVVKEKNNFGTLPGLECMNPVSPFIRVLNYVETTIDTPLVVIAGDAVGEGFFKKLSMFLVDFFYQEDNDLVVNTSSMKKGTRRKSFFQIYDEQRADVNHFNYFINSSSQKIILDSLQDKHATSRGFYSSELLIEKSAESLSPATRSLGSPKDKPVLFVLPGIMGSHLTQNKERIWLNYLRLATGQLNKIRADQKVQPEGINGDAYKELVDYFSNSYYVVPFAYDWRHTVFNAADELKVQLDNIIKDGAKNISFIVHSMGGLVIRAFIIKYPALWKSIQDMGNCRIVMLGTPNEGSYDVPYLLTGHGKTIRNVAMLDLAHSMKSLLQQFIEYPGLLQLLPVKVADDFRDLTLWN